MLRSFGICSFYIRIEDTDRERLVSDAVDVITTDLKYFDVTPDEGVISGSEAR